MSKITDQEKDALSVILTNPVYHKAVDQVLNEMRHRSTGEIDKNAMAHCFNEGMLQFVEKLNELVGVKRDTTIRPRKLR